jgi:diguanylate cyclase (GGDEF)-like protein/PAS domain S-box-containing protein
VSADLPAGGGRLVGDERVRALVRHSLDMVSIYDAAGRYLFASPSHERVLGYRPEDLVGTSPVRLLHPDECDDVASDFALQLNAEVPVPVEHRIRHHDGSWRYIESIAVDLSDDPGVGGVLVSARDVTDRRQAEILAADQARILEQVARGASLRDAATAIVEMVERWTPDAHGALAVVDEEAGVLRTVATPQLEDDVVDALDGFPVGPVREQYATEVIVTDVKVRDFHPETGQTLLDHGYLGWWAATIRAPEDERALGALTLFRRDGRGPDEHERRLLVTAANLAAIAIDRARDQERLAHQASHDALTGLPNRQLVVERLRQASRHPRRRGARTAVLFLDIDRFKVLNDSVGHDAGDRLLVEMGARLREVLRPGDLVARFGGDEFVMVCEGVGEELDAYTLANRILEIVCQPFEIDQSTVVVTASVGIAMVDGRDAEDLVRDADAAMYWAKERGRARAELFDDALRDRVVRRHEVERELRGVVEQGSLALYYQPIVSLVTGRLAGFEALLRWPHPTRGLLTPDAFLEVAEEAGLARPLGAWVRNEACRQAAQWERDHPEWGEFMMSVNLTSSELRDHDLAPAIAATVEDAGIDPARLVFEITERFLADDTDAAAKILLGLRDLGVQLALDDFGTGAAALLHLKQLPVDSIKIDRTFVAGLGVDRFDDAIVDAIVDLTRHLGLRSVAEGVETTAQEQHLRSVGCRLAQGHRFAPALAPADLELYLARRGGPITVAEAPLQT